MLLANVSRELGGRLDLLEEQVAGAVRACGQICSEGPGEQDSRVSEILSALERRVLDSEGQLRLVGSGLHKAETAGEAQQAMLEGLQGILGRLQERMDAQEETAAELSLRLNLTASPWGRGLWRLWWCPGGARPPSGWCGTLPLPTVTSTGPWSWPRGWGTKPWASLDGFSVFGGSSGSALQALQGELSEVILTFSSLNDSLHELQTTVEGQGTDLADLGATKDSIISEINRP